MGDKSGAVNTQSGHNHVETNGGRVEKGGVFPYLMEEVVGGIFYLLGSALAGVNRIGKRLVEILIVRAGNNMGADF